MGKLLGPYKKGEYYDEAKHRDLPWEDIDEYGGSNPWASDYLTHEELVAERGRLIDKYGGRLAAIMKKKRELGWIPATVGSEKVISTDEIRLTDFNGRDDLT